MLICVHRLTDSVQCAAVKVEKSADGKPLSRLRISKTMLTGAIDRTHKRGRICLDPMPCRRELVLARGTQAFRHARGRPAYDVGAWGHILPAWRRRVLDHRRKRTSTLPRTGTHYGRLGRAPHPKGAGGPTNRRRMEWRPKWPTDLRIQQRYLVAISTSANIVLCGENRTVV